jgi:type II secretory pathway component PulF
MGGARPGGARRNAGPRVARRETAPAPRWTLRRRGSWRKEIANLTSQLAIMTRSGIDVASAIESLNRQCRRPELQRVLQQVHDDVTGGQSLSQALAEHPGVFSETYIASVSAGEASGRLSDVLNQLAHMLRNETRLQSTVRTMFAYPVLLASVSSLVLLALVLFVLPQFAKIFADYDTPLPWITQMLIGLATELRTRFWLWGSLAATAVIGLMVFRRSEQGRLYWDRLLLHASLLRDVTRALAVGRVCRLLGVMLESGVPLLEALQLSHQAVDNRLWRRLLSELENDVLNGRGLSRALLASDFVPPSAAEMIATAERTGNLGEVACLLGDHYEEEGQSKLREFIAVLEPAITVGMGVVVATVVLAVMLPMFDLSTFASHGPN